MDGITRKTSRAKRSEVIRVGQLKMITVRERTVWQGRGGNKILSENKAFTIHVGPSR